MAIFKSDFEKSHFATSYFATSMPVKIGAALLVIGALSACDKKNPTVDEKPTGVIPQAQLNAMNKAKSLDNELQQQLDRRNEQSEKSQQ